MHVCGHHRRNGQSSVCFSLLFVIAFLISAQQKSSYPPSTLLLHSLPTHTTHTLAFLIVPKEAQAQDRWSLFWVHPSTSTHATTITFLKKKKEDSQPHVIQHPICLRVSPSPSIPPLLPFFFRNRLPFLPNIASRRVGVENW